jgi:hypothetical protein
MFFEGNGRRHGTLASLSEPRERQKDQMKELTLQAIQAMTPEKLAILYENARKRRSAGGQAIMDLIDASGLPLSSGGMRITDPTYIRMREIIWSNRADAIKAAENGLPALAGVERLIVRDLGNRYHPHDLGTANAGSLIGELMRHLGYVKDKEGKMPDGSVAKTAMKWKRRKS